MMAIRLSTAIKWDSEEADDSIEHAASLEALRHIEGGFIVTPEAEALAAIHDQAADSLRIDGVWTEGQRSLAYEARRRVDSLVDR